MSRHRRSKKRAQPQWWQAGPAKGLVKRHRTVKQAQNRQFLGALGVTASMCGGLAALAFLGASPARAGFPLQLASPPIENGQTFEGWLPSWLSGVGASRVTSTGFNVVPLDAGVMSTPELLRVAMAEPLLALPAITIGVHSTHRLPGYGIPGLPDVHPTTPCPDPVLDPTGYKAWWEKWFPHVKPPVVTPPAPSPPPTTTPPPPPPTEPPHEDPPPPSPTPEPPPHQEPPLPDPLPPVETPPVVEELPPVELPPVEPPPVEVPVDLPVDPPHEDPAPEPTSEPAPEPKSDPAPEPKSEPETTSDSSPADSDGSESSSTASDSDSKDSGSDSDSSDSKDSSDSDSSDSKDSSDSDSSGSDSGSSSDSGSGDSSD